MRPTDLHRPLRRRADPAQPGRPDRALDHAPGAGGAGLLVRVRLDAVRAGALPVREPRSGSSTTTRATSSSSTTGRPAAGSTRCTCWPRRCSTGRRSAPAWRTGSCSATTGRRCPSRGATTRTSTRCSTATARDAMRWFLMASPILRGGNLVVTEQGIRDGVRQAILPLWNTWYFLSLYASAAGRDRARRAPTRRTCSTATCWPRTAALVDDVTAAMDVYDIAGRLRAGARPRRGADQLVRAPLPRPVLGRRRRTRSTRCTRCWR